MTAAQDRVLAEYNAAILSKSADRLADLYRPDAVHELPFAHSDAATMRGPDEVRAAYAAAWGASPVEVRSIDNVVVHPVAGGDTFVVEQDLALTHSSTGRDFVASTVLVIRLEEGRIAHVRDYTDNLTIATALGRAPAVAG